jgi:hypothetical protein
MSDGYKEFLLAVVNADDRKDGWRREEFRRYYRRFFPLNDSSTFEWQKEHYEETRRRWKTKLGELPVDSHDSEFGYHVAILRHRLRVVWMIAFSGDIAGAKQKLHSLYADNHRYLRLKAEDFAFEPWRVSVKEACSTELEKYLDKLRLCKNRKCKNPYFIRHGAQRYCSIPCAKDAKALRQYNRDSEIATLPKDEKKRQAALLRWERIREAQRNETVPQKSKDLKKSKTTSKRVRRNK